jgi:hypothetical protein
MDDFANETTFEGSTFFAEMTGLAGVNFVVVWRRHRFVNVSQLDLRVAYLDTSRCGSKACNYWV